MNLGPDKTEKLARARADLRMGVPVMLSDGLICAVETLEDTRLHQMRALGELSLAITDWRARTLKAVAYDGEVARVVVPADADVGWLQAVANPADDLGTPMKGPLRTRREGAAEAARHGIQLAKAARLLPSVITVAVENPAEVAEANNLTYLADKDWTEVADIDLQLIVTAKLPLSVSEAGRLHVFRPNDGSEEHYAVEIGSPDRTKPVLTRLHSACFTGDLLGSLKCDCGPQLRAALAQMGSEGRGVLLYLNQEGRGIGLANKMRAYALQDQGFDTVEANHRLGFKDDERDFRVGAAILRKMGFRTVRLLTNNPAKITKMNACGIEVAERVALKVGKNRHNHDYLATKAQKSGHLL